MRREGRVSFRAPTEAQELILRAALCGPSDAAHAWRRWRSLTTLDDVDPESLRVLGLVYRNLAKLGIDDSEMARLKGVYRHTWSRNQLLFQEASQAIAELEQGGIPTMVLGPASLLETVYRDVGVRAIGQVDVLVPAPRVRESIEVLRRDAWIADSDEPELGVSILQAETFRRGPNGVLRVHPNAHWQPDLDDDWWAWAVPIELPHATSRAPCAADGLLSACLPPPAWLSVPHSVWAADAITLIREAGERLDWERLCDGAVRRHLASPLTEALGYLRARLDAPVPTEVTDRLDAVREPAFARVGYRARARPPGAARTLGLAWARYRRLRRWPGDGSPHAPRSYLAYLHRASGYSRRRDFAEAALRRVFRKRRGRADDRFSP